MSAPNALQASPPARRCDAPDANSEHEQLEDNRVVLSGDGAAALVSAYALLGRIAERAQAKASEVSDTAA